MNSSKVEENAMKCSSLDRIFRLALSCTTDELFTAFQMYATCSRVARSNLPVSLAWLATPEALTYVNCYHRQHGCHKLFVLWPVLGVKIMLYGIP